MIIVVDTNVVVSAAFWPKSEDRRCFVLLARRKCRMAVTVEPSPLGKQRSRDANDDPFLACALASRAEVIVTKDKDLLALDKPFGVDIVAPREFYRRLKS